MRSISSSSSSSFFGASSVTPVVVVVNDFFFVFVLVGLELNANLSLPAALYFECWLDTELANTDKERSVVARGGVNIVINFNFKASSK
jgi:hypothetical protein